MQHKLLFISPEKLKEAEARFRMLIPDEFKNATKIFEECGPGNTPWDIHRPYERYHDYELMLRTMRDSDKQKYFSIHKGTPFYFLAWTAFYIKDYAKAVFYMDSAISEDMKNFPDKWSISPAVRFLTMSDSSSLTLSPFFGQLRGFLKVDRKPASCAHFIHFEDL